MNDMIHNKFGRCEYEFKDDYVHIYNLHVFPEFRRQGKARELLQLAINAIRSTGYTGQIQIVADPVNDHVNVDSLRTFYESMGLEVYSYYG